MGDELTTVLRLVAEGKLSADEAAPIIEALGRHSPPRPSGPPAAVPPSTTGKARGRRVRIQVTERGRRVVDVRVPLAFAAMAARMVPGIPDSYAVLIERAVEDEMVGPIVDLAEDEDGDAVLITVE
ncbi:MAG: hypothetical protein H0W81_03205 [Chloroflexi bacterium]|nr:hypothetical protein [Chloroflexota bacterium]